MHGIAFSILLLSLCLPHCYICVSPKFTYYDLIHMLICSVVSNSLLRGILQAPLSMRFFGKNTGVGCHFLFQGIFLTRNRTYVSCSSCIGRQILYFPGSSAVKNLPSTQETWVQSLGWEDPLEKEMATRSSILAWEILWTEKPGGLQSTGSQRVRHD